MSTRPPLTHSIPFWGLLVVSLATIGGGWYLTTDKLGAMTKTLTDGTATGVDVYVGQSVAQLGGILIGAGVVGVLLTLAIAALSTLRPHAPVEIVEPIDWTAEDETFAVPGEVYTPAAPEAAATVEPAASVEPSVEAQPAETETPEGDESEEPATAR